MKIIIGATTTKAAFAVTASAMLHAQAWAGIMPPATSIPGGYDPQGYQTYQTLSGRQGVASDPLKWFNASDGYSKYTNWANKPITFTAAAPDLAAPVRVGVTAFNHGTLGLISGYTHFIVGVTVNGTAIGDIQIAASDTVYNTAWFDIGAQSGPLSITLKWRNDQWTPNVHDANIAISSLQIATDSFVPLSGQSVPSGGAAALAGLSAIVMVPQRRRRGL